MERINEFGENQNIKWPDEPKLGQQSQIVIELILFTFNEIIIGIGFRPPDFCQKQMNI